MLYHIAQDNNLMFGQEFGQTLIIGDFERNTQGKIANEERQERHLAQVSIPRKSLGSYRAGKNAQPS